VHKRPPAPVEVKIEEQAEFVEWWRENIRGKGKRSNNADPGYFVEQAETLTGITQQQVSKWSKRLADRGAYRERLYGAAWRAAQIFGARRRIRMSGKMFRQACHDLRHWRP